MPGPEKIAIVLATYNPNPAYFRQQIQSIQSQTWRNWVCHIVDDRSQPESQQLIRDTVGSDNRFICHFHPQNLNSYHNFERGLQSVATDSTVTAIAFADQDDIWQDHKLSLLLETLRAEQALLVHSDLELIDGSDRTLHASAWEFESRHPEKLTAELLLLRNTVTGCSVLFCATLLSSVLPFPPQVEVNWYHDVWVAIVAAQLGKVAHVRQPLVRYRIHGSNTIGVVRDAGKLYRELIVWLSKKCRITGKSYLIHRNLSQAFYLRFQQSNNPEWQDPFSDRRLDFGLGILRLGWQSWQAGYGSEGIALRIWALKLLFDLRKLRQKLTPKLFKIG
ncbi:MULTISPECIES: glycosyltransferase [Trichocoleus]|uniref:Glycosyltransferase n=1 Tax=Trichocoleus desertorum GB2-A4 TaxID=2933944 RepID=A0ABV0JA64_9CYAN|nr:glycosyltransferase [Trichocoleus sp. FACHB-46]MBD1861396.1 glycosyltransferase [Trichocoleus sp. FACHB-46]